MQYLRIGPTPWVRTSQPASVSMGEPQLPSWVNSQGCAGRTMTCDSYQKWGWSENIRWMLTPSCRLSMA